MQVLPLIFIFLFLFSCKRETGVLGNWKKTISPSLAKVISAKTKDSLENADFFALDYVFDSDRLFRITNSKNVQQKGRFYFSSDSLLTLEYSATKELERFVIKSPHPDSLILYSEFGSITYLKRY